jgi:hypothetical protein
LLRGCLERRGEAGGVSNWAGGMALYIGSSSRAEVAGGRRRGGGSLGRGAWARGKVRSVGYGDRHGHA